MSTMLLCVVLLSACVNTGPRIAPPRAPAAEASMGGTLRVGLVAPGPIEPTFASQPGGLVISSAICDTLVQLDPVTGEPFPGLIESWQLTDVFAIKLRGAIPVSGQATAQHEKMFFHGGDDLEADDVKFTLERLADPDEASYSAAIIEQLLGYDMFRGTGDGKRTVLINGIQISDPYGFLLRGGEDRDHLDLVRVLAHPTTAIMSKQQVLANPAAAARRPPCAGPYEPAEPYDDRAAETVLVRDETYHDRSVGRSNGGAGYADQIIVRHYADAAAALAGFEKGEVDVIPLAADQVAQAGETWASSVVVGPTPVVEYLGVPVLGLEGFDQDAVRVAISQALDRTELVERVYHGAAWPATGFVPPTAGEVSDETACPEQVPPRGDVAAARRTLQEANIDLGELQARELPLHYNDEFSNAAFAQEVARQLEQSLGLQLEPTGHTWEEFIDLSRAGQGFDGLFRQSWQDPVSRADRYLTPLIGTDQTVNLSRFDSLPLRRQLAELAGVEEADRTLEFAAFAHQVCVHMPLIPVAFRGSPWLIRADAVGLAAEQVVDQHGLLLLRELYVKEAE